MQLAIPKRKKTAFVVITERRFMITQENLPRLIEFGGTHVYTLTAFDPINWRTNVVYSTFNEEVANAKLTAWQKAGQIVKLNSHLVRFDLDAK